MKRPIQLLLPQVPTGALLTYWFQNNTKNLCLDHLNFAFDCDYQNLGVQVRLAFSVSSYKLVDNHPFHYQINFNKFFNEKVVNLKKA